MWVHQCSSLVMFRRQCFSLSCGSYSLYLCSPPTWYILIALPACPTCPYVMPFFSPCRVVVLVMLFTSGKKCHDYSNSHKRKHFIGGSIGLQRFSPLSSWQEAWRFAGRLGAGGAQISTSSSAGKRKWIECHSEHSLSEGDLKVHPIVTHFSSKVTPAPTRPCLRIVLLPMSWYRPGCSNFHCNRSGSNCVSI